MKTRYYLALFILLFIGWSDLIACGDEWETRTEEMQAQFDASIEAECRYIKCRELDEGR